MRAGFAPLLIAVCLAVGVGSVRAQEVSMAEQAQALETFFKVGLPDTRGAKWVKAELADDSDGGILLPGGGAAAYSGNAWLVREEKNGTVELIVDHARRVRARRVKEDDESTGRLPAVQIRPADLNADLQKLAETLKSGGRKSRNSVRIGEDYLDSDEAPPAMAAGALLFCAHLQQQGRAAEVGTLIPAALAFSPDPAATLDYALSIIAGARLRQLTDVFVEKRDATAYAQSIEKLAGEFPRGWKKRDAALLLARRVREQKPAPEADNAGARKAAALLLGLKSDQVQTLPMNSNWLLPADTQAQTGNSPRRDRGRRMPSDDSEPTAQPTGPTAAFFAERRTAFAAIARLLDDYRLVALRRREFPGLDSSSVGSDATPAERLRQQYTNLDRPVELREIAWSLVQGIIPDRLRSEIDDHEAGRAERVLAWFQTVAPLSDEDFAWTGLRQADSANDRDFDTALGFLVAKGNAESQKLLQEVFLDPAVWSSGSRDGLLGHLETYAGRLGPAAAAFSEKLQPVVAAAIKARYAEQAEYYGKAQGSGEQRKMIEQQVKMMERQAAGELKKFNQLFKPQGLAEMLAELADADKEGSMEIWQTLQGQLAKVPWPQAEAQLFQTAPKAKDPAVRSGILSLILQHDMRGGGGKQPASAAPDAPTRAALETLLADTTPLPEPIPWAAAAKDFSALTALAFVMPRISEDESLPWQKFMEKLPEFSIGWLNARARALAAGQPAPPIPDAKRVPAGRAEAIVQELAALAPEKVLAALLARTPDEQAAAVAHLGTLAEWPPAILGAHFTVTGSQTDGSEFAKEFNADRWKGRRLDETLRQEIAAAVEQAALDGHACMVGFSPVGVLGGLKFVFQSGRVGNIDSKQLAQSKTPLLDGQPPPAAIIAAGFTAQEDGQRKPIIFAYALWKNPDLSRAWREKFARPAAPSAKPAPEADEAARYQQQGFPGRNNDPAPLDNAVRELLTGKPAARGQFSLWWLARPVGDPSDEDSVPPGVPSLDE